MAHLLQCAVWQAVAADAQLDQPLIQFTQEDCQAGVLCSRLWQVDHRLAPRLLHQPRTRDVVLCQREQRCKVCDEDKVKDVPQFFFYLIINTKLVVV